MEDMIASAITSRWRGLWYFRQWLQYPSIDRLGEFLNSIKKLFFRSCVGGGFLSNFIAWE